jgi:hypothetical protein
MAKSRSIKEENMKKILVLHLLAGLLFLPTLMHAQQRELKVLFVGNSYTYGYNLPHIVSIISERTSTRLITRKSVIGGATLKQHWKGLRELETKRIIAEEDFDLVVLQAFSMAGVSAPDTTLKYIRLFSEYVRDHGAEPCLYNTWAREKVPQFQAEIDAMYEQASVENSAVNVPVGAAWELAMEIRPTVDLFTSDGSHPNELGTMLTASMFVRVLTGELPQVIPSLYRIKDAHGEMVRLMNHNQENAEFCRRIANQVVEPGKGR